MPWTWESQTALEAERDESLRPSFARQNPWPLLQLGKKRGSLLWRIHGKENMMVEENIKGLEPLLLEKENPSWTLFVKKNWQDNKGAIVVEV